jgi:hypothetical protein
MPKEFCACHLDVEKCRILCIMDRLNRITTSMVAFGNEKAPISAMRLVYNACNASYIRKWYRQLFVNDYNKY